MGIRPYVRGVAMNPVDHPLGGGEGRSHGGRHPTSPWGWLTKGKKTRKKKKASSKFIIKKIKDKKFLFCCGSRECLIMAIYHREGI